MIYLYIYFGLFIYLFIYIHLYTDIYIYLYIMVILAQMNVNWPFIYLSYSDFYANFFAIHKTTSNKIQGNVFNIWSKNKWLLYNIYVKYVR